MNKIVGLGLIVALVVGVFLYINRKQPVTNYPSKGSTIVAFGDSLTSGVGASGPDANYVSILSQKLSTPIINEGVSGDTSADALARVQDVIDHNPKIVIVVIGGNDALQHIPQAETFKNIEQIIVKLQGAGAIVVLGGIQGGIFTDVYKSDFKRLSDTYHTAYVPNVLTGIINKPQYMSDSVHPNDVGYVVMADRFYPIVKELMH